MRAMTGQQHPQIELRFWQQVAIFLFAFAILITRRPDAIFHAQFWAEDGHVWFAEAYNLRWWVALFRTQDGYFQTLPRLAASLALMVPLYLAPLVLNTVAIAVRILPANLLLSYRSSSLGSLRYRAILAGIFLALPNSREMDAIVTSSQWVLALYVFLLLVGCTPRGLAGRLVDISFLLLCGLTGPFCFFLLPIALFLAWIRRDRWLWAESCVLSVLCFIQTWGLLIVNSSSRARAVLGASPTLLKGSLLGSNGLAASSSPRLFVFLLCIAIGGTALVAICFAKSAMEMKLFLLFCSMLLAASLFSSAAVPLPGVSRWELLAEASGIRYWFFPNLAFAWSLLWCFNSRTAFLKVVGGYLLFFMSIGIIRDWKQPAFNDLHFAEEAKRFAAAPEGTAVTISTNPEGWNIRLVKHPPDH